MNVKELAPGTSWSRTVTAFTSAAKTTRQTLAGATIDFQLLDRPDGTVVLSGGVERSNEAQGQVVVSLSGGQSLSKADSVLFWRVRATIPGVGPVDLDTGKLILR